MEMINTCSRKYLEEMEKLEKDNIKKVKESQIESLEDILGEEPVNDVSNESKKKVML